MKRLGIVAAVATCTVAGPVQAQATDGAVESAVQNTISANLKRRGYLPNDPVATATTTAVAAAIDRLTASGSASTGIQTPTRTWAETIKGMLTDLGIVWPLTIGKAGQALEAGGGSYGGGGASGAWGDLDCSSVRIEFDAQGYLIIPSYSLNVGAPITYTGITATAGYKISDRIMGKTQQAAQRFTMHYRVNAFRAPIDWYGVIGPGSFATVAYRKPDGTIVPRLTYGLGGNSVALPNKAPEIQCPQSGVGDGGDAHYYGDGDGYTGAHLHTCHTYIPTPEAGGEGGYFINPKTTIPFNGGNFPLNIAPAWKTCALDPNFIKKIADAISKNATKQVGYNGAPYSPIADEDVRPGPTKVDDLADEPTTGTRPTPTPEQTDVPPPTVDPTPPPTTPPSTDILGSDPNIGTPSDPEAPTNIMAPVFDWLPDLPNIQLNTAGAQCPTWEMQPFEGPEWHLVMDDHCPFIADNAALISTIMILGFTVGSAMIILRA